MIKKALSYLSSMVRERICVSHHAGNTEGDVESGERNEREEAEAPGVTFVESPAAKIATNEFRKSVQNIFSDTSREGKIMWHLNFIKPGT